jgi:hypothetical protein
MNRRRALRVAGTATAAALGGTLAMAANFGLLGFARSDAPSLGLLEATSASADPAASGPKVVTRYEDIFVPGPSAATEPEGAPTAVGSSAPGSGGDVSATAASGVGLHVEDDHDDDGREDDEDHEEFEDHHEDDEHEAEEVTEGLRDDD